MCVKLAEGLHRRHAAAAFDLDETTFSRWFHRGAGEESGPYREFFLAVQRAEAAFAESGLQTLKSMAVSDAKIIQWQLSRRFPDLYGRRDNVEKENPEDRAAQLNELRQTLVERFQKLCPEPEPEPVAVPDAE